MVPASDDCRMSHASAVRRCWSCGRWRQDVRGRPQLEAVEVDHIVLTSGGGGVPADDAVVSAPGANPEPILTAGQVKRAAALARPRAPTGLPVGGDGHRHLDDVLPVRSVRVGFGVPQLDTYRRSTGSAGERQVHALAAGGTCEAVGLAGEEAGVVAVETNVVTPDEVELAVVGLDRVVEEHLHRHALPPRRAACPSVGAAVMSRPGCRGPSATGPRPPAARGRRCRQARTGRRRERASTRGPHRRA